MNIFITGVAGFLGSHLADRMLDLGHTVSGNDNLIGGYLDNVDSKVNFKNIDCLDLASMSNAMNGTETVIHCAALAHDGYSMFSPTIITENILQASVSTITAAIKCGVKKFIYCSSMARYGNQPAPFTEDMATKPVTPYGISKVAGEEILKLLCTAHGMEWTIVVPHNIIGPRQKYNDPYRNVVSIVINKILLNEIPTVYGDGNQLRAFSYIDDCVDCIEKIILNPEISNGEIFNIGPDKIVSSINDIIFLISKKMGYTGKIEYLPGRINEVFNASCSSDKIRTMLGYKEKYTLEWGINKTIEYIIDRGPMLFDYNIDLEIYNGLTPNTWKRNNHGLL